VSDVPPDETPAGSAAASPAGRGNGAAPPPGEPGPAAHDVARRSIERERDAAETSRDRFAYLAEASRCLASSLDYETTLITAAGLALPYLGAWCIVDVITEGSAPEGRGPEGGGLPGIRRVAVLHPDPAKQAVARALHERYPPRPDDPVGAPRVIRRGRPEVVSEAGDAALEEAAQDAEHLRLLRALGVGAYVIAPMVARGRVLGAITFVTTESGRRFGDLDVTLAEDLASRSALAVDNARLHGEALQARAEAEVARATAEAAQRQAEAASRAKGEFLAVMSHELRTPLNAIGGYAELIELGVHGPVTPEQRADLGRIQKSQRHLLGLINGVLNYSRVEAGAVDYAITDVPLDEVLAACEGMVAPQMRARRLAFAFGGCDPALRVRADEEKLQQIVLNLLTNAGKFTEPGGRVTLEGAAAGVDAVAIRVADTGRGMAPEQQGRIFEPFVQVDARLTRTQEGVGLGLAISRDLARGMGGDLTVASTPGVGSTFTLTLPAAAPTAAAP
jgi:signal transduction histidine kinase